MRQKLPIVIPVLIGLLAILLLGNNLYRTNDGQPEQYGTPQGRNLIGEGTTPYTVPDGGNMSGNNRYIGWKNNPSDITGIGANPGPNNNMGLNRLGSQSPQQTGFDSQKAENIRNKLGNIDGIKQINTVVNGHTAIVGYSPVNTKRDVNATRKMIASRVKQIDKTITNVIVSSSGNMSSRIGHLAGSVRNNMPVSELNIEYNQLVQGIRLAG